MPSAFLWRACITCSGGAVERGTELYSPCKEAYEMLKGAVVGGPSLVFIRYHEVGITKIRDHQIENPLLCKNIIGYALLPSIRRLCWKTCPVGKKESFTTRIKKIKRIGRGDKTRQVVWICGSRYWDSPTVVSQVRRDAAILSQQSGPLRSCAATHAGLPVKNRQKPGIRQKAGGALSAEMLVYAPLLRWHVGHGAEIKEVHRTSTNLKRLPLVCGPG